MVIPRGYNIFHNYDMTAAGLEGVQDGPIVILHPVTGPETASPSVSAG